MLPNPLPIPGSKEQGPMMVHVVWVNHRAFRLQWCQQCCFYRPPRTYHCPWCNICVEVSAPLTCPPDTPSTWPGPGGPLTWGPVAGMKPLSELLKAKGGSNSQPFLVTHAGDCLCADTCPGRLALACIVADTQGVHICAGLGQARKRKSTTRPTLRLTDSRYPRPSDWL